MFNVTTPAMNSPFTLVRPDHYVVTMGEGQKERVTFGRFLPLSKRAAGQYARQYGGRVIKRTTAQRGNLI
ncbi:hypothetical protein HWB05_gp020 [Streptomyces phage BRock]|uniref:Uncharacterized protein n=1 Tax=Streptomyces phage BRock TaxID=1913591 RepID=A0A1J0GVR5_9CAUD|nr:hypothetical protein HWB05_gp020 [Streptomyces phage BRock]APC46282.1 hypothetical protein [Streptomyces phage BRock]